MSYDYFLQACLNTNPHQIPTERILAIFEPYIVNKRRDYLEIEFEQNNHCTIFMDTEAPGTILISRAITERPDFYAAVICNVGIANAMRAEFSANGPANIPEFGTVKDSLECRGLYEMDGMQHVVKGTKYPAVLYIAGWNDSRVAPWEPGKFAAALQNASASDRPILMKVNYNSGHTTEDKLIRYQNLVDQMAFYLWQCGQPGFEAKQKSTPTPIQSDK